MMHLKIAKIIHYAAVAVLVWAASQGFHALLASGLDPVVGWAVALGLALCVGGMLSVSLCHWRVTGSFGAFVFALLFAILSLGISLPLYFSWMRGDDVVTAAVEQQREEGLRQVIRLHDALVGLAGQAETVAAYSTKRSSDEQSNGRTCEEIGEGAGPRQRFRAADANRFAEVQHTVTAVADRVKQARAQIETLSRVTATNLPAVVRTGNEAFAVAGAAAKDAVLHSTAEMLRERARTDGDQHNDPGAKRPFRCPDPQIAGAAARMATLIDSLPQVSATIEVPDVRNPRTTAVELPVRIARSIGHQPGGLEAVDWSALGIGGCVEFMVFTSGFFAHRRRYGLDAGRWNTESFNNPEAVRLFINMLERSRPNLDAFIDRLERYSIRLFMLNVVLVSYGCTDEGPRQVARVLPLLTALGIARRDRRLPPGFLGMAGWLRWRETRGASRREAYRVNRAALDELMLAAVVVWENGGPPAPPAAPRALPRPR